MPGPVLSAAGKNILPYYGRNPVSISMYGVQVLREKNVVK
jgi:hypothetical protein